MIAERIFTPAGDDEIRHVRNAIRRSWSCAERLRRRRIARVRQNRLLSLMRSPDPAVPVRVA